MEKPRSKIYYGWWIMILSFLLMGIVYSIGYYSNGLFIDPLSAYLQVPRSTVSLFMTVTSAATLIASPIIGRLYDQYSARIILVTCLSLFTLSLLGFYLATELWHFFILSVVRGAGFMGSSTIAMSVLLNRWFGVKKRGLAMGISTMGSNLGTMILAPLLTSVIEHQGWRSAFLIMTLLCAALIPIVLLLVAQSPEAKGLKRLGDAEGITAQGDVSLTVKQGLRTPAFWLLILGGSLLATCSTSMTVHFVPYMTDIGYTAARAAIFVSIGAASMGVGKIVMGRCNDWLGVSKGLLVTMTLLTISIGALFAVRYIDGMLPVHLITYGLGMPTGILVPPLIIAKCFGNKNFATLFGFYNVATGIGTAAGSSITAWIAEWTGSYSAAWLCMLVICSLTVGILYTSSRKTAAERLALMKDSLP
jgi:MFS family permease